MNAHRSLAGWSLVLPVILLTAPVLAQDEVPDDERLFAYDRSGPLHVVERSRGQRDGFLRVALDYPSPDGGRVPAHLYEPSEPASSPAAAVVLLHGMPGTRQSVAHLAAAYARAGVYVLAISAPWARQHPDRSVRLLTTPLFTERDSTELVQAVRDLRRAIDYLVTREDIAADRIGFVGHSAGAMAGAILTGVEQRLAASVLMAPSPGWVSTMRYNLRERPDLFWLQPFNALSEDEQAAWMAALEPLEATRWIARARDTPVLVQGGSSDRSVPREDVLRLFAAARQPKAIAWYPLEHRLGEQAFVDQARFLARHLGFDAGRFAAPERL